MMYEISPPQPLLSLDPDLGQLLSAERTRAAAADLRARVVGLDAGEWDPSDLGRGAAANLGLLVVSGVLARELCVHDVPSAELFGPGDIIRTRRIETSQEMLRIPVRWTALGRASVAVADRDSALALRRYPEVEALVLDRVNARAERLAVTQAISQITGVETRLEMLLWHLAERWGRIGTAGVIVPVALSHRMFGSLVGARRPTVSTALARLVDDGRVARRADGSWLLTAPAPPTLAPIDALGSRRLPGPARTAGIERPLTTTIGA